MDMTVKSLEGIFPSTVTAPYMEGRELEYAQPLVDLGYLSLSLINSKPEVRKALRRFRLDYKKVNWTSEKRLIETPSDFKMIGEPDSLEIKLLHLLVDMDGDFLLPKEPEHGAVSLWSRILYYRLNLMGFYEVNDIDAPYDSRVLTVAINQLLSWMMIDKKRVEWINLLGDIPKMIETVYNRGGLDKKVVCFKYKPRKQFSEKFEAKINREDQVSRGAVNEKALIKEIEEELKTIKPTELVARSGTPSRRTRRLNSKLKNLRAELLEAKRLLEADQEKADLELARFEPVVGISEEKVEKKKQDLLALEENLKAFKLDLKRLEADGGKKDLGKRLKKWKKKWKESEERAEREGNLILKEKHKDNSRQIKVKILTIENVISKIDELKDKIEQEKNQISAKKKEVKNYQDRLKELNKKNKSKKEAWEKRIKDKKSAIDKKEEKVKKLINKLDQLPGKFRRELEQYLSPDFYKQVRDEILNRHESPFFNQLLSNPYNHFLVRLVQLHQWVNGYYFGRIDSKLGKLTFNSIREIAEDIDTLNLSHVLYRLDENKGTWLLNIHYLFAEILDSYDDQSEHDSFEDAVSSYEENIQNNPALANKKKELDKAWEKTIKEREKDLKNNKLRRIYFGIKSLVKSIVRGIKRIIKIIISSIKEAITLFKNFVLMLYRETREGLRKLGQGIAFLFGRRVITTSDENDIPAIVTKFDVDFDVITMTSTKKVNLIHTHHLKCMEATNNLRFSLILTVKFVEWVIEAAKLLVLGWGVILVRLAIYFRKLLKQFLKRTVVKAVVG